MMTDVVMAYPEGSKIQLLSPIVHAEKGTQKDVLDKIRKDGFNRVRVDGNIMTLEEVPALEKNKKHSIDIVVDRLIIKPDVRSRVFESIETCLNFSKGLLIILNGDNERLLSDKHTCPKCGFSVPRVEPRLFSFNSPKDLKKATRKVVKSGLLTEEDVIALLDVAMQDGDVNAEVEKRLAK